MNMEDIKKFAKKDGIVFLAYGGFLSQALISGMTEALERESAHNEMSLNTSNNMYTIFIELTQNMMSYSKGKNGIRLNSEGLIVVGKNKNINYYINSQNIVDKEDKESIEAKLLKIKSLDKDGIKQAYRELRRSGKDLHGKGAGIGFYEIAKRCDEFEFEFQESDESNFYFNFKAKINIREAA